MKKFFFIVLGFVVLAILGYWLWPERSEVNLLPHDEVATSGEKKESLKEEKLQPLAKMESKKMPEPLLLDLNTFRKVKSGGDLQIVVDRTPIDVRNLGREHYDWHFTIEVLSGGGIQESNDEFMNIAPVDGYLTKVVMDMKKDDANWKSQVQRQYYVNFRSGGLFGKIVVDLVSGGGGVVEIWTNPSGSRNLEYDPEVQARYQNRH
jgi:hypothetical protein